MGCGGSKDEAPPAGAKKAPPTTAEPTLILLKNDDIISGVCSDPGFGADEEDNQDVPLEPCQLADSEGCSLVGLFDGHGEAGREIATMCKEQVVQTFAEQKAQDAPPGDVLNAVFKQLHASMVAAPDVDVSESGASATLAYHDKAGKRLVVANVGDCKAVIGCRREGGCKARQLTEDHYPGNAKERARIQAAGGRVAAKDDVQLGALPTPGARPAHMAEPCTPPCPTPARTTAPPARRRRGGRAARVEGRAGPAGVGQAWPLLLAQHRRLDCQVGRRDGGPFGQGHRPRARGPLCRDRERGRVEGLLATGHCRHGREEVERV
jgi:hypothetical protein